MSLRLRILSTSRAPSRRHRSAPRILPGSPRDAGKVRWLCVSIHDRPRAGRLAAGSILDTLMIRYNAAQLRESLAAVESGLLSPEEDAWMRAIGSAVHG